MRSKKNKQGVYVRPVKISKNILQRWLYMLKLTVATGQSSPIGKLRRWNSFFFLFWHDFSIRKRLRSIFWVFAVKWIIYFLCGLSGLFRGILISYIFIDLFFLSLFIPFGKTTQHCEGASSSRTETLWLRERFIVSTWVLEKEKKRLHVW